MNKYQELKQLSMELGRSILVNSMEKLLTNKEYKELELRESISFQTKLSQYNRLENKFKC